MSDSKPVRAPNIRKTVRVGVPHGHRRDIVFFLLDGSWRRFFASVFVIYLAINVFFASLYHLIPATIANCTTWTDAFFFSVQTISTIGYGNMHPISRFGNTIMTAEAALGILTIAMITGLMVAKASRAKAGVLFSDHLVIRSYFGKPTLQCRIGNARGNDIVDAKFGLAVLIDETTPEGETIRRIHDLKLARSRSPFFMMTMLINHEITPESPLYNMDWTGSTPLSSIVATVSGHDATYGQATHARHFYHPSDVLHDHRFSDIIDERPDGRFVINYRNFHAVTPLANYQGDPHATPDS